MLEEKRTGNVHKAYVEGLFYEALADRQIDALLDGGRVDFDTRPHRRCHCNALEVHAFRGRRLGLFDSVHEDGEVFCELGVVERRLTEGLMKISGLIVLESNLTLFDIFHHLFDVRAHRVCLWVRHETGRTKDFCDLGELDHHVGCCNRDVEVNFARRSDLSDEFFAANNLRASVFRLFLFIGAHKGDNLFCFTDRVREDDRRANLLIALFDVDAQVDVDFYRAVEFGRARFFCKSKSFFEFVEFFCIDLGLCGCVAFAACHSGSDVPVKELPQ